MISAMVEAPMEGALGATGTVLSFIGSCVVPLRRIPQYSLDMALHEFRRSHKGRGWKPEGATEHAPILWEQVAGYQSALQSSMKSETM